MDKALLIYELNKRGIKQGELCEKIGMSRSAFHRKCNGVTEFTQGEIQAIVDFLGLDSPIEIFFNNKVS
jgi:transcriptional regulator with XRE-family HTH domain